MHIYIFSFRLFQSLWGTQKDISIASPRGLSLSQETWARVSGEKKMNARLITGIKVQLEMSRKES
jgi:hypothetical protein